MRRETHLDQLADKLKEERVRRVVEPLLSGGEHRRFTDRTWNTPATSAWWLWRLQSGQPPLRGGGPARAHLGGAGGVDVGDRMVRAADGGLLVDKLLAALQAFFREHSEHWVARFSYQEAGPQLLLQAFLQRVVNGGGRIEREYGLGRGRTDLLIVWPQGGRERRFVVECKLLHRSLEHDQGAGTDGGLPGSPRWGSGPPGDLRRPDGRRWEQAVHRRVVGPPASRSKCGGW